MKNFLLFILVATASAQAWPFHKKPKYVGVGPTLEEQKATEANQQWEKAKADQMQRIKEMRNKILAREPRRADLLYFKEKNALANFHYSLEEYEKFLSDEIKSYERHDLNEKITKEILEAKNTSDLERPRKQIKELQDALAKKENEDSWHDTSFQSEKQTLAFLNHLADSAQAKWDREANEVKAKIQFKADRLAKAKASYETRKHLTAEQRNQIYLTNNNAYWDDWYATATPEAIAAEDARGEEIHRSLMSKLHETKRKHEAELYAIDADIAATRRAKENSDSLSRMASAMEKQAIAAEQAVFDSSLNSRTAPSLPSDTYSGSKVEYSRTILPSGQTISTTTWK
jgi:hypothetical protein